MRCPSFAVPSVRSDRICVWPRVKSAEPCVRGETPTSHVIGRISSVAAAVGAPLLDGDLPRGRAPCRSASAAFLTYCFVRLSFTAGASPSTVAGPTGNGRSTDSMIRS